MVKLKDKLYYEHLGAPDLSKFLSLCFWCSWAWRGSGLTSSRLNRFTRRRTQSMLLQNTMVLPWTLRLPVLIIHPHENWKVVLNHPCCGFLKCGYTEFNIIWIQYLQFKFYIERCIKFYLFIYWLHILRGSFNPKTRKNQKTESLIFQRRGKRS